MVDDERKPEKLARIKKYLQAEFPDLEVRQDSDFGRAAEVFTIIRGPASNFFRFIADDDYVDDHTEEEIATALENLNISQLLQANESHNVFLGNGGIAIVERG